MGTEEEAVLDGRGLSVTHPATGGHVNTLIAFAVVGASGIIVNQAALWALVELAGLHYVWGAIIATQCSTTWNFLLNEWWVFRGRTSKHGALLRFLAFAGINNAALLGRVPLLAFFTSVLGLYYLVSNLLTLIVLFAVRFALSDGIIWRTTPAKAVQDVAGDAAGSGDTTPAGRSADPVVTDLSHAYDLHGIATVASQVELPELEHFRVESLTGVPDIEIRVGNVGLTPRRRIKVVGCPGEVCYQEQLGVLGANFRMDITDRIRIKVSQLLADSPHVVYTNVIEALLRFVMASRGYALLHSATLEIEGHGIMLSAHTDTGKTHTILRMLREVGGVFLSDDMSIIAPDGRVFAYPKPLTISHHTLSAVDQSSHSWLERMILVPKSCLHSKKGRGTGMRLARMNLPIMSMNAITQAVVPPPKYAIGRLVPCEVGSWTRVERLFLIARGPRRDELVEPEDALQTLTENTDDAYGFPPFQSFAPLITLGGEDYQALRRRERSILRRLLEGVRVQRMVRDDFSWADEIPRLVRGDGLLRSQPELTTRVPWPDEERQVA